MHRYLNVSIFEALERSTRKNGAALTALLTGFRYLFREDYSLELFSKIAPVDLIKPDSTTVIKQAELIAANLKVKISGSVYFSKGWKLEETENTRNWITLKNLLLEEGNFLILHTETNIAPVMGFASFPFNHQSPCAGENRWVIICNPTPWHSASWIHSQHLSLSPPLHCVRLEVVRSELSENAQNGIICLSRHCL